MDVEELVELVVIVDVEVLMVDTIVDEVLVGEHVVDGEVVEEDDVEEVFVLVEEELAMSRALTMVDVRFES